MGKAARHPRLRRISAAGLPDAIFTARLATYTVAISSATYFKVNILGLYTPFPDPLTLLSPVALENSTAFNKTLSENLPLSFSGSENLFNTSISCPSTSPTFTASVSLDVEGSAQADFSLGAVAAGTIIPPEISELGLTLGAHLT